MCQGLVWSGLGLVWDWSGSGVGLGLGLGLVRVWSGLVWFGLVWSGLGLVWVWSWSGLMITVVPRGRISCQTKVFASNDI